MYVHNYIHSHVCAYSHTHTHTNTYARMYEHIIRLCTYVYVYMHIESGDDETNRNNESKGPPAQQKVHYHMS